MFTHLTLYVNCNPIVEVLPILIYFGNLRDLRHREDCHEGICTYKSSGCIQIVHTCKFKA